MGDVMTVDPVCGMEIEERDAKATSTYDGEIYYFCSDSCRKQFDRNPTKYLTAEQTEQNAGGR